MFAPAHPELYRDVIAGLKSVGYDLIEEEYTFEDWFKGGQVSVDAAAFGQTPVSYDSACIGVVNVNGLSGNLLIDRCRALGAPFVLELSEEGVTEWAVSRRQEHHQAIDTYIPDAIGRLFQERAANWRPEALLRAKNIGTFHWIQQLGLFEGLLPELEEHIQAKLDPLLKETLSQTSKAYLQSSGRQASPESLFRLVFWLLTAKVFHDRRVPGFENLGPNPDDLINAVVEHQYGLSTVPRLLNQRARIVAAERIWDTLDFKNLSVEVLAQIWSTTLVDRNTRKALGIHRTPRPIVQYVIDRLPFEQEGDDERIVLEPCCGSAAFLVGTMNALRPKLFGASPTERHRYFVNHLVGIEKDPFAVEISRLSLTLADFPNQDGWTLKHADVFENRTFNSLLSKAGIVLCNPPFEDFTAEEKEGYGARTPRKPAELLTRILDWIHPRGVLGFVLPRTFVDGRSYADVRQRLAERYATVDLTLLPDKAFPESDAEVALLVAKDPIPHRTTRVMAGYVADDTAAWRQFELTRKLARSSESAFTVEDARKSLVVPELAEVWDALSVYPTLGAVSTLHLGIEWNRQLRLEGTETGARTDLIRTTPAQGFKLGVPPQATFGVLQQPELAFLNVEPRNMRRNSYLYDWDSPKVILNKARRSRGPWRIAAFPDRDGVTCYKTFIGVWVTTSKYDEVVLSAVLNSPVANAFVYTHGSVIDLRLDLLRRVPVPTFTENQKATLHRLVNEYQQLIGEHQLMNDRGRSPGRVLMEIDACVLDAYRMPPRVEKLLLDFFNDRERPTVHTFGNYVPANVEYALPLSQFLLPNHGGFSVEELLRRTGN